MNNFLNRCEDELGLKGIQTLRSKPFNGEDILQHFGIQKNQYENIVIIGDRLMTDIALANIHGMLSIYCKPIHKKSDLISVKFIRPIEEFLLHKFFVKRRINRKVNV